MFRVMDDQERIRFRFFLDTACREQEVAAATWRDIDWKKGEFIVRAKTWKTLQGGERRFTPKNHTARRVPMSRELVGMLKDYHKASKTQRLPE